MRLAPAHSHSLSLRSKRAATPLSLLITPVASAIWSHAFVLPYPYVTYVGKDGIVAVLLQIAYLMILIVIAAKLSRL